MQIKQRLIHNNIKVFSIHYNYKTKAAHRVKEA